MPNKKKKTEGLVDSSLTTKESSESLEQTKAELEKPDPSEDGRVIAKLIGQSQKKDDKVEN
jgi:hypothetical protein